MENSVLSGTRNECLIEQEEIQDILETLMGKGYKTIGPKISNGAIVYDEVRTLDDLPMGWQDVQEPGSYRLIRDDTKSLFQYVVGPHSWKKFLHPASVQLFRLRREDKTFKVMDIEADIPKYAFLGIRSCDINAIGILDRVFDTEIFSDPIYTAIREKICIVAVNCTRPGETCFCSSMNTGPKAISGFDIALTEIFDGGAYRYLAEARSTLGINILKKTRFKEVGEREKSIAKRTLEEASQKMGRKLNTEGLRRIFYEHFEHQRWKEVAERCLACGNCTLVCPTCFCTNMNEVNSLTGEQTERWRKWDSCFSRDFTYMHGGCTRPSVAARYRQWLTHKLATWVDQFGTYGCVGCGRCITWCPVGIDITKEASAIVGKPECP